MLEVKASTDDIRFLFGLLEALLESVNGGDGFIWDDGLLWEYIRSCACLVVDAGLNQEAMPNIFFQELVRRALGQRVGESFLEGVYINNGWFLHQDKIFSSK